MKEVRITAFLLLLLGIVALVPSTGIVLSQLFISPPYLHIGLEPLLISGLYLAMAITAFPSCILLLRKQKQGGILGIITCLIGAFSIALALTFSMLKVPKTPTPSMILLLFTGIPLAILIFTITVILGKSWDYLE